MTKTIIFIFFSLNIIQAKAQKFLISGDGVEMLYYSNSTKKYDKSAGKQNAVVTYNININESWIKMTTLQTGTKKSIISDVIKNNNGLYEFIVLSRTGDNDKMKITYNLNTHELYQYMDYNSFTNIYTTRIKLLNPISEEYK